MIAFDYKSREIWRTWPAFISVRDFLQIQASPFIKSTLLRFFSVIKQDVIQLRTLVHLNLDKVTATSQDLKSYFSTYKQGLSIDGNFFK